MRSKTAPKIHQPDGLDNLFGFDQVKKLTKRVDRKQGTCAVCDRTLGRFDLAFQVELNKGDVSTSSGDWFVSTTHRACKRERVNGELTGAPRPTYTTTLMSLPVVNTDDLPDSVPVLMVNPAVDHFVLHRTKDGEVYDKMERLLIDDCGFRVMDGGVELEDRDDGSVDTGPTAYVNGPDVTVAINDQGVSWTHEQPEANRDVRDHIARSLKEVVEKWDGSLLVMVSSGFTVKDPMVLLENLPKLIEEKRVLAANADVEFKESPMAFIDRAFQRAQTPLNNNDVAYGLNRQGE